MKHLTLFLLLACTSTPTPPPTCAQTCAGCCDSTGTCRAGTTDTSCGKDGTTCTECAQTERCTANVCTEPQPQPCGPTTCAGCCDDAGICNGGRTPALCGTSGVTCTTCARAELCSAGTCIEVKLTDLSSGADAGTCSTCTATRWRMRVLSAVIAPLRPTHEPWDDKNDPDPMTCAIVGDAGARCTLETGDTFTPQWNFVIGTYDFEQLSHVELSVIDVDFPGQTVIDELGVLDLRPRAATTTQQWNIDGASVSRLRIDLEPAP